MRYLVLVSLLFANVAYANPDLQKALDEGNVETLKTLLANGVDPNVLVGPFKDPALAYVAKDNLPLVEALLDAGANPNLPNGDGETPLDSTVTFCYTDAARLMISKGGKNHRAKSGSSTLNNAVIKSCNDIVELLVRSGADVNEPDAEPEQRALTSAISGKNLAMTQLLIAHGAKANYSVMGISLVDLAQASGNPELVEAVSAASK